MRRRAAAGLAASPTMVGAVTVLVAIVAVFLAYNANNGLPFIPTYQISVQVPDAASLVPGNEVRVGGVRVGVVEAIEPEQNEDGKVYAKLDLKLDRTVEPLPTDSTLVVRSRSALGLKYLEINKGTSDQGYPPGSVVPLKAATPKPVEIDQVLNTFDEPTRTAIQQNLLEFGDAVASRGPDLNAAIGSLADLMGPLQRVMTNLSDPQTRLGRFFSALSATAAEVAPVAQQQADMFASLDTTFGALANVTSFIQETISEGPPTEDVAIRTLPQIRPFLAHSAALFQDLQPGIDALQANANTIASSLEVGAPVLADSPELNDQLPPTARTLLAFAKDKGVKAGINRLNETLDTAHPTLRFVGPAETVCAYASIALRNASSIVSQGNGQGSTWQRFVVFNPPSGVNNEGSPSSAPANGGNAFNFLHINPYPNTASPGQDPRECEAGNEGYLTGQQVIGNVPGDQGLVTDPAIQDRLP
jgi:virulence factor Mce-like protein